MVASRETEVEQALKCQYCEGSVDLPFKCPLCGRYFCADHRLPENHACPELLRMMIRRSQEYAHVPEKAPLMGGPSSSYMPELRARRPWSSSTEILHLTTGSIIVMAVGLSYVLQSDFFLMQQIGLLAISVLVFTSVFLLHELAHKIVAVNYGLWAEFRLTLLGALVTILSIILPIKLVSPGAVVVSGEADKKTVGVTALSGPFTNMMLSTLFLALSSLVPNSSIFLIMIFGATLSSWISLFNLLPFSIMDGAKVFWWNRKVWATFFLASLTFTLALATPLLPL